MGTGQIVGLHLRVHGLYKQSGVAAVVLAFAADGTLVDWVGEESVAIEAVVVGKWLNHRVVGTAKFGFMTSIVPGLFNHVILFEDEAVRAARALGALASFEVSGLDHLVASALVVEVRVVIEGRLARHRRRARSRTVSWCRCREKWTVGVVMWATAALAQWIHHSARSGR